jgi:large subunit ribosomal protein L13
MIQSMSVYTIDAAGKVLGRVATEIARVLCGKNRVDFAPHRIPDVSVVVTNANRVRITGRKLLQKRYFHHSGFPGGAKFVSLRTVYENDSRKVIVKTVSGMLPKNKLRARLMKHLTVHKGEASA